MFLVKGLHFVDFQCIGVSVFVKVGSGDAFSTAWGCKGGKSSVVLVSRGGVRERTLSM